MAWYWSLEDADGNHVGESERFDAQADAETWIGLEFGDLLDRGVEQVRLQRAESSGGSTQVYGPMSLRP